MADLFIANITLNTEYFLNQGFLLLLISEDNRLGARNVGQSDNVHSEIVRDNDE